MRASNCDGGDGMSLYLSPAGMPFYVAYSDHYKLAGIMGLNQNLMEIAGWLHISGGRIDPQCLITKAQRDWIDSHDYNWRWNTASPENWETKQPVPYRAADKFNVPPTDDEDRFFTRLSRGLTGTLRPAYAEPATGPVTASEIKLAMELLATRY